MSEENIPTIDKAFHVLESVGAEYKIAFRDKTNTTKRTILSNIIRDAVFSPCGEYRYRLTRIWDNLRLPVMVIGLNPSTANADRDDFTIRLLTQVIKHLGYPGFHMMNLYGLITPHPKELIGHPDPMGDNEQWLKETAEGCQEIIFAWGAFKHVGYRVKKVMAMFPNAKCFSHTANGSPLHPRAIGYIKDWESVISLNPFMKPF